MDALPIDRRDAEKLFVPCDGAWRSVFVRFVVFACGDCRFLRLVD